MTRLLLLGVTVTALLAACSSVQVPQEVHVPVPVPCVAQMPERPALRSAAELLALDRYRRTLAAWADLHRLAAYAAELEAATAGCTR